MSTATQNAPTPALPVRRRPHRRRSTPGVVLSYALILIYSATLLVPLYWLVISAFKPRQETIADPFLPTFSDGVQHFSQVWKLLHLDYALGNSVLITGVSMVLSVVLAAPAAYALTRARGRLGRLVEGIYSMGFLIPGFAALLPSLLLAIKLDLFNTRTFMMLYLPGVSQPLAVILLAQFMRTVPRELEESAAMDGAGRWRILLSVYLPLAAPGIATISILNFISFWNEYLYTLLITGATWQKRTIQVALPTLQGNQGITDYALLCAGTTIAVLPTFLVYAILNRRMESALVEGALKG